MSLWSRFVATTAGVLGTAVLLKSLSAPTPKPTFSTAPVIAVPAMAEPTPSFYIPSRLFYSLQHLDFGQLLSLMLTVDVTITPAFFVIRNTAYRICGHYTSTVEVRSDDQTFDYLMYWMREQKQYIYSTSFVASVATSMWDNMLYSGMRKRTTMKIEEDNEEDIALAAEDFNTYWSQRIRHGKTRPIKYTPCDGVHLLRYIDTDIVQAPEQSGSKARTE